MRKYTIKHIKSAAIKKDSLNWTQLLFDHRISIPLVWLVANFTNLTPNQITVFHFILRLLAAYLFFKGTPEFFLIGGLIYFLCRVFDNVDGQLARLKEKKSTRGAYIDPLSDVIGDSLCIFSIFYGQFLSTQSDFWILSGVALLFLNDFLGIEAKHLKLTRFRIIDPHGVVQSKQILGPNSESSSISLIKKVLRGIKSFQDKYKVSIISIDISDIRFVFLVVGPISGFVKECVIIGIGLMLYKLIIDKVIQIWRKEPVFFN